MKKFFIFLFILLLPSVLAIFSLYYFSNKNFTYIMDLGKEKIVSIYPWLNKYIHLDKKIVIQKVEPPLQKEKPIVPNLHHFTNAEIFSPICGKNITEKHSELFMGCNTCPKYLNNESSYHTFEYFSETRGTIFKKEEEEAIIFMKGCSNNNRNGMAIVIRKGFGGWQRQAVFQGVVFDQAPLEFQDSNGLFVFISTRTLTNNDYIRKELIQVRFNEKEVNQIVLFSADMIRHEKCDSVLQSSIESPVKKNDHSFETNIEVIECGQKKISGSYKLIFNLKNDVFIPNKETASLMTKIEKHSELK